MADSSLPDQIVESIAISNAKSIGEQPAILSNLALANQILNNNMQQQMMLSQQQAIVLREPRLFKPGVVPGDADREHIFGDPVG